MVTWASQMDRTPGGFGGKLRDARERRGITLRQIANATKISPSALEALERNDISRLPGGIFSRAFVKSYAIEVGLDPDETIREFIALFPHDSITAGHPNAERRSEDNEEIESDRRMASTFLRIVALSVPVAGIVLYFSLSGRQTSAPPVGERALAAPVEISESAEARVEPVAPVAVDSPDPEQVAAPSDRLAVGLLATAPCWVSATVDGQKVIARELQPGERQQLDIRRELILSAGDAAALTITFNGAEGKSFGRAGEVVTRRIDLANFKEYLAAP